MAVKQMKLIRLDEEKDVQHQMEHERLDFII